MVTRPPGSGTRRAPPLVIGVGNDHRRDDRCGLDVVRELKRRLEGRARLAECPGDALRLLDLWGNEPEVIVIDAVRSGHSPGRVMRLEVTEAGFPSVGTTSTHGLSLAEAIGLARSLGRAPDRLVVYAIEAADVGMGDGLSPEVAKGVHETADRVAAELDRTADPARGE